MSHASALSSLTRGCSREPRIARRVAASVVIVALLVGCPGRVEAAPAESDAAPVEPEQPAPVDAALPPETGEQPVEGEPPLDTDQPTEPTVEGSEPPLDTDEPPLDTDEQPLDTNELDTDEGDIADDYDPTRDSPEARAARRWLGAGIGSTITGAVLVGGAIAFGLTEPCNVYAGNNCFADARNRAALTMGVPGGVLLLGGIAMIVFGALQKQRVRADLAMSREQVGVVISGRF